MNTTNNPKTDSGLLDELDQAFSDLQHTQVPEIELADEVKPSLVEQATKYMAEINEANIKLANAVANAPINPQLGEEIQWREPGAFDGAEHKGLYIDECTQWETASAKDLFGNVVAVEPVYRPTTALIGADIIAIRALTGKQEKAAKAALHAATVEMMNQTPADSFFIQTNVASSKNGKEIGFYLKKNPITGKNDKINILVDSKVTQAYRKATAGQWLQNKVAFLNQVRGLPLPLSIEFTFIRDSMRRYDMLNACQVLCDLMVANGYIPDDDSCHIVPVFNRVTYYHPELSGVLFKILK